jgi:hypothetical protein
MNANDKLTKILETIDAGKTIYVRTALRATKVTAKNVREFDAINRPLFKVSGNSLFMSFGKRYDCIDYCSITVA